MADKMQATRLGDILLEKGLVNTVQLREAIVEQQRRRACIDPADQAALEATSLGEILIELGHINRQQLKRGLSWQMSLRRMTIAMALCAPLMSLGTGAAAATTSVSSSKASSSQPLTIQAESYTSMYGIQTQPTTDEGGGLNVGYIHANDWLAYGNAEIYVPVTGTYKVTYRLASIGGGGIFALREADASVEYDRITVPSTGGEQMWVDVVRTITLPAGTHRFGITVIERGSGFNFNWFRIESVAAPAVASSLAASSAASVTPAPSISSTSSAPSPAPGVSSSSASSKAAIVTSSAPAASAVPPLPKVATLPVTIQAEDFSSMFGIQTESASDVGGGLNVGYIHPNDWLSYSGKPIRAPVAGNYKFRFRVASPAGGGSFALHSADGSVQYGVIQVPSTGGSQAWADVEHTVSLPAGDHSFGITAITRGSGFNINWFNVEFKGIPLPVKIEAENYSAMYGIQTELTTDVGGGKNVAYIHPADWMSYADTIFDIPATGSYKVTYRVASPSGGGSFALHEVDGSQQYDLVDVPASGGSQKWVDVERLVNFTKGSHSLAITAVSRGSGFNINWFKVEPINGLQGSSSSSAAVGTTSSKAFSSAASSAPAVNVSSSSQASAPATNSSAAAVTASVKGPVMFKWEIPNQRENGTYLDVTELGGYELRYRRTTDNSFIYVSINDAWQNYYSFSWLEGDYVFQIAAFDKNGIYSNFVDMAPQ